MRVYGIELSSTPSAREPLAVAMCRVQGDRMHLDGLCALHSLECFHNLLHSEGPWIAGLDLPGGLREEALPPALRAAGAGLVPVHPGDAQRLLLEARPALAAQALLGAAAHGVDSPGAARGGAERRALVAALGSAPRAARCGAPAVLGVRAFEDDLVQDARGAQLDAVLCALQAAAAWRHRGADLGGGRDAGARYRSAPDPAAPAPA